MEAVVEKLELFAELLVVLHKPIVFSDELLSVVPHMPFLLRQTQRVSTRQPNIFLLNIHYFSIQLGSNSLKLGYILKQTTDIVVRLLVEDTVLMGFDSHGRSMKGMDTLPLDFED